MFMGEYHHNLDEKQRLIIPSKYREMLGSQVIITRGLEESLFLYSVNEWEEIIKKLKSLPFTSRDARGFLRIFLSSATVCDMDKQGRIVIPTILKDYAKIDKECTIIGNLDHLEVWSSIIWKNYYIKTSNNLEEVANNLFDSLGE